MSKKLFEIVFVLAALLHVSLANYYQVEILLELQQGIAVHRCNGAIIYEKLIITPANCVFFKLGSKGKPVKVDPSDLSVVAGTTNAFLDALRVNVSAIDVAENFNPYTLENDLALLTLSQSLPLGTRPDMKWIMLDDNIHVNHSCLANFFSRNSKHSVPNYYQTEELTMYNNEICRNYTKYPHARKDDICSIYVLPQQLDCAAVDNFLAFNPDRGTGLVCKSYLVGLLSEVVTRPNPSNNCTDVTLAAIYTNIFPHLMWVYSIMANIETEYISTPYDASVKSLVINTTYDKEYLTTTYAPLTTVNHTNLWNITTTTPTTTTNSPITNSSALNSTTTNSTTWNHTIIDSTTEVPTTPRLSMWNNTNSTTTNSTTTNFTTTNSTTTNTTTTNSTTTNSTTTNFTIMNTNTWNHPSMNSSAKNSSMITNPTATGSPTLHVPLSNSSTDNSSEEISTNTTARAPPTPPPTVRFVPKTEPAITDSYIKDPPPTVRNFFKNSSTSVQFSAGCLLIAIVSLRLINIYY